MTKRIAALLLVMLVPFGLFGCGSGLPGDVPDEMPPVAVEEPLPPERSWAAGTPFGEMFAAAGAAYGVDPALLAAVAWTESRMDPRAVSRAGAAGLMQLMPATARELGVRDPFDPQESVDAGARLLRRLLDRFGGDMSLALAAYNAGPAAVKRHGGMPPFSETRGYVAAVLEAWAELSETSSTNGAR